MELMSPLTSLVPMVIVHDDGVGSMDFNSSFKEIHPDTPSPVFIFVTKMKLFLHYCRFCGLLPINCQEFLQVIGIEVIQHLIMLQVSNAEFGKASSK